jgi:hypothetical protein
MKIIATILLLLLLGCFIPDVEGEYELKMARLKGFEKLEIGYHIIWTDGLYDCPQFIRDTAGSGYYIGMQRLILMKK